MKGSNLGTCVVDMWGARLGGVCTLIRMTVNIHLATTTASIHTRGIIGDRLLNSDSIHGSYSFWESTSMESVSDYERWKDWTAHSKSCDISAVIPFGRRITTLGSTPLAFLIKLTFGQATCTVRSCIKISYNVVNTRSTTSPSNWYTVILMSSRRSLLWCMDMNART